MWRDLARFRQLDHVHGRRVAAFPARSALQRGLKRQSPGIVRGVFAPNFEIVIVAHERRALPPRR